MNHAAARWYHLAVLLLFTALAVALTWPLAAQFADHVPGTATWSMDEYGYVWNHWWFKYALIERGMNPFQTNYQFYPLGTGLVLYAYTLLHVALGIPLQFAFGLIPAVNATVLFSFIASGYGMFLLSSFLVRVSLPRWQEMRGQAPARVRAPLVLLAAILAGIVYAFSSNRFVYVSLGHYNVIATEWLPFYLLFFFKTLLYRGWRFPILAGLFAAFALYSETTDGVLLALLTVILLVMEFRLLRDRVVWARLAAIAVTAGVFFAPMLIPTLDEILHSGYTLPGWGHAEKLLVDLNGFFAPTSLNPLNRGWEAELDLVRQGISRFSDVNTFFVGWATALLALIGALRYFRNIKVWMVVALGFAILSLGPLLHINGVSEFDLDGLNVTVPLPFLLLHYIPILRENRVPNRYSLLVVLALAVLVGYAVYWLLLRLPRLKTARDLTWLTAAVALVLAALLVGEHLAVPLPLTDARVPAFYSDLGRDAAHYTVLTLPLGWRNSFGQLGAEDTRVQYYQSASNKYTLAGQIQRNPPALFDYYANLPVVRSLIALETYNDVSEEALKADQAAAPQIMYFFDIRYVVVNAAVPGRPPYSDTRDRVLEYVKQVLPLGDKVYDKDGVIAWQVKQAAAPARLDIDLGTDAAGPFQAEGWSAPEGVQEASANWLVQTRGRILFPLRTVQNQTLTLRAIPFNYPDAPRQRLTIQVNGESVGELDLDSGWKEYSVPVPASALHAGLNELIFSPAYLVRPRDVLPANFTIGATGVSSPVDILVQSTPQFGSIKINGREVSPLKRGYNLAVLDPKDGRILQVKNFDTGGSSVESRAFNDWLGHLPNGVIVTGATQEEAGVSLGARVVASFQSLGLITDLRAHPDYTHAFVGVKGARPGTAAEKSGAESSLITVGHAADDRSLSAALDWIRIEPKP